MKFLPCALVMLLLCSCASNDVVLKPPPKHPDYKELVIAPPKVKQEVYDGIEPESRADFDRIVNNMRGAFVQVVSEYFKKKPLFERVVIAREELEGVTNPLVFESFFTVIEPGNELLRFFVPIFGKPHVEMSYRLRDGATGAVLEEADDNRDSSVLEGKFEGGISTLFTVEIANECIGFIEDYMTRDLNETDG